MWGPIAKRTRVVVAGIILGLLMISAIQLFNSPENTIDYVEIKDKITSSTASTLNNLVSGSHLTIEDLNEQDPDFPEGDDAKRYESIEAWRGSDAMRDTQNIVKLNRPKGPAFTDYKSIGDYLQQPIVSSYPEGSEKIFFMIKTGANVLWERLPVHLYTSLPKMPKFALYSDAPGSLAGYEVLDTFANITEQTYNSDIFEMYRLQRALHHSHGVIDHSFSTLNKGWDLDRFKNVPILRHGYRQCPECEWFFMMDADTYVMVENLVQWLKDRNPNNATLFGNPVGINRVFAHGGSGILLSNKAVEMSVANFTEEDVPFWEEKARKDCCGDAVLSNLVLNRTEVKTTTGEDDKDKKPFQDRTYWDVKVSEKNWCTPIISFHHATSHDMEILYEYEKLKAPAKNGKFTYGDIYRDLYQPYIQERVDNWDNGAIDQVFIEKKTPDDNAWKSFEDCRAKCRSEESCLSYRYLPNQDAGYCGIATSIRLGRLTHKHLPKPSEKGVHNINATSGWMVDRIRKIRLESGCDPIASEPPDKAEGWFRLQAM